jgi:asparagine synthase (glutamine-hydrolysing)
MCGFFGVYSRTGGLSPIGQKVAEAGRALRHRGPDDEGLYADEHWQVCFRRLSIIDTSRAGHQPMASADGNLVIAFNGEIYNHLEIRSILLKRGHIFAGRSDTETLLRAYQEYGADCVHHLRGMFVFTVWNRANRTLHVFRDRLGIKPLYMCQHGHTTLFSSEIKAILAYAPELGRHSERAAFKYLARGWTDDTPETFYRDISAFPPASVLTLSPTENRVDRYWQLPCGKGRAFNLDEFRSGFTETVSLHLQSDVPLATTLSGGMDSSSITAVAARVLGSPDRLQAFSVIPPNTVDESFWIDRTVAHTGIRHSYLDLQFDRAPALLGDVLRAQDEPFQSSSCLYQYLLRRKVREQGIKVLLVGEGGDEVLGGYRRLCYPYLQSLRLDQKPTAFEEAIYGASSFLSLERNEIDAELTRYTEVLQSGGSGQENVSAYDLLAPAYVDANRDIVAAPAYPTGPGNYHNPFFAHLAQHLFVRDIPYVLRMEDRNSMAHGIEARVPFLDHRFIELVFSYDYTEFMRGGSNKSMLRRAMKGYLPNEVITRKDKSPRPGNDAHLVYGPLRADVEESLAGASPAGWLAADAAARFRADAQTGRRETAEAWFRIYSFIRWRASLELK